MAAPQLAVTEATVTRLRRQTELPLQALWRRHEGDLAPDQAADPGFWSTCEPVQLNDKGNIAWPRGRQVIWLGLVWETPVAFDRWPLAGADLRLTLTWWADQAQVFIDGVCRREGDLFDALTRLQLPEPAQPGRCWLITLRLVSPGHDDGGLVQSALVAETPTATVPEPGFVADELATLCRFAPHLGRDPAELEQACAAFDPEVLTDRDRTASALMALRDRLQPWSAPLRQRCIRLLGHAHLDLAWLWPVAETWRAAERTFESVLALQQDYPELLYTHSTPALYAWVQQHRPDLFARIRAAIANGQWELAAGLWLEPELNLTGAESLVRQLQWGQTYAREQLQVADRIAWLPDIFGFPPQLPQLLRQAGVRYFVTQKLRWNDTNPYPHELFRWRSPDGSEVLALMSAPIGTDTDPVKMADYAATWEERTGLRDCLWLPGVGDHGGGPTREMLERVARWQRSPFFPRLEFGTAHAFLEELERLLELPVVEGDLYLELHRGCWTAHLDQKQFNRRAERSLRQAETWATVARTLLGRDYPQQALDAAWERALFNQFHDILPGSSIPEVYADANPQWRLAIATAEQERSAALEALAAAVTLPEPPRPGLQPRLVVNPLPWPSTQVLPGSGVWFDGSGQALPSDGCSVQVSVPGLGWQLAWVDPAAAPETPVTDLVAHTDAEGFSLGNAHLSARLDGQGRLVSLRGSDGRETLAGPANDWCCFRDQGQFWDAWNIDPAYEQHPLEALTTLSLTWVEQMPLRLVLRRELTWGTSRFRQDYILDADSPLLRIETWADWQERHVLVKLAFPTTVQATEYWADLPAGAIARPTRPLTPEEQAQWEAPAQTWVDLSDERGGLALLLDGRHGFDCREGQLRLSILRGSTWPDPDADRGEHCFAIGLYPHSGDWRAAAVPRMAMAFSEPLSVIDHGIGSTPAGLPSSTSLLDLPQANLLPLALLPDSDSSGCLWRGVDMHGQATELDWRSPLWHPTGEQQDLVGQSVGEGLAIAPHRIATFRLSKKRATRKPPAEHQSSWSSKGSARPLDGGPKEV